MLSHLAEKISSNARKTRKNMSHLKKKINNYDNSLQIKPTFRINERPS